MKPEIHPKYEEIAATCSCGNVIKTRSTVCEDIHLDVPLGNILNEDLAEIYHSSPQLSRYRNAHEKEDITSLKLCRDCHVWGGHLFFEKQQMELGGMSVLCQVAPSGKVYQKI